MQSADEIQITWPGRVTIEKGRILIEDFQVDNASCRDKAIMATAWAIGELQRELLKDIQAPGGGATGIGGPCDYDLKESVSKGESILLEVMQDGMPLLMYEGSLKSALLYAAGQLTGADRLILIEQLRASHLETETRFR